MLRRYGRLLLALYVASDAMLGIVSFGLSYLLRFSSGLIPVTRGYPPFQQYVAVMPFVAVLVPLAALNFYLQSPLLTWGGMIAGLVVGLVVSFKQSTNPALVLSYAGLEGLFVGGISALYEDFYDGIVGQAVLGTLAVFAVALWAYTSGRVRATPKFQRGVLIAMGGYLVFCLVNLGVVLFTGDSLRSGWMGIGIGLIAITIAAAMLILDFDFAEQGVKNGLPERYSWLAAFGLVVTLVWLYIEFLRLIAILRGSD